MKLFLFVVLITLISCSHKEPWQHSAIRNTNPNYDMAKLSYEADSLNRGIRLELIRQSQTIEGYLNVLTFEIPPHGENLHQAEISLIANGKEFSFLIDRLEGGQRLHLSEKALDKLIELFQNYEEVTIHIAHYTQTFSSVSFDKQYRKLCFTPPRFMPEKFVTFELY
jgi:hypothetical protein